MADRKLDIIIAARSAVAQGFANASSGLRSFADSVGGETKGAADQAAKMLGVIAKARVVTDALRIGVSLVKGEWEKVDEIVDKLPFGIGPLAQSIRELAESMSNPIFKWWYGVANEPDSNQDAQLAAAKKRLEANKALAELAQMERSRRGGEAQQALQRAREVQLQMEQIAKRFPELQQEAATQAALAWVDYYQKLNALAKAARDAQEEEAKKRAETLRDLDSEIRQKQLEAAGKTLDAELDQIREHYRKRIDEAKNAAEKERLLKLRTLDEEAAKRRDSEQKKPADTAPTRSGIAAVSLSQGFLGIAARFAAGNEPAMRTAKASENILKTLTEVWKTLRQPPANGIRLGTVVQL